MSIVILLLLIPPGIFWLIQFVDCLRNQREHRLRWVGILLLLNVIGAWYYWRLRPKNNISPADFDQALNTWLERNGFSLSESSSLLKAVGQKISVFFIPMAFAMIPLRVAVDYVEIPKAIGVIFFVFILILLIWMAVSVTKIWWLSKGVIPPFLTEFIFLSKSGKEGMAPSFGNLPNDPIATKSVSNLLMADFLLFIAPIFSLGGVLHAIGNISKGNGIFGIVMLSAGCLTGLMFLFIAIQINSKVIFYHKPDYVFKLLRFYRLWKWVLFVVLMMLILGFGAIFIVLAVNGQNG